MRRALVIRHHSEDSPGLVGEALVKRGFDIEVAMMDAQSPSPRVQDFDALVILGSKHAVYDEQIEAEWFGRELEVIDDAQRFAVPVLGICFGAQALCRYHGGIVGPSDEPELGWYEIEVLEGADLSKGPWFEYHFDRCTLPKQARLWARTPRAVQAFSVGANVGVQFHPEIDDVQLAQWLASGDDDARAFGLDPAQLLARTAFETPGARLRTRELVDTFLLHAARTLGAAF
ncbi:MAG TPA: hypothetical protein VMV53_08365 [Acidimicrobiales bacterium]|nr:hypothetical protein [Acidimicrobiales bacterium]